MLTIILFSFIQDDFDSRGINFETPDFSTVRDNKQLIKDMMTAFQNKYPDKGYLIVVDEFLSYLTSRNEREIVLDLEFFRALGEMCSKSRMRVIFGVQEKIFENPGSDAAKELISGREVRYTPLQTLNGGRRIRIVFLENSAYEPVIANTILKLQVPLNILKADTRNVNGKAVGEMILGLPDGEDIQNSIIEHFKGFGLAVSEVNENE